MRFGRELRPSGIAPTLIEQLPLRQVSSFCRHRGEARVSSVSAYWTVYLVGAGPSPKRWPSAARKLSIVAVYPNTYRAMKRKMTL